MILSHALEEDRCHRHSDTTSTSVVQAVNISGDPSAAEVTDVSLQLTVATTADQTTSLYVFLGGNAVDQLNQQLKAMGEEAIHHSIAACLPVTGTKLLMAA